MGQIGEPLLARGGEQECITIAQASQAKFPGSGTCARTRHPEHASILPALPALGFRAILPAARAVLHKQAATANRGTGAAHDLRMGLWES